MGEILGIAIPTQTLVALLEKVVLEEGAIWGGGTKSGDAETAIAPHKGRDALKEEGIDPVGMPTRNGHKPVVVGVDVDETGGDDLTFAFDRLRISRVYSLLGNLEDLLPFDE